MGKILNLGLVCYDFSSLNFKFFTMAALQSTNSTKVKLLVPAVLGMFLIACGGTPAIPLPPGVPSVPGMPTNPANPLAPLTGLAPNSEVGDAMQGLGALSQLGNAFDQQGNVTDPNAMQNFLDSIQQIDAQQKAREFAAKESLEFPSDAPAVLRSFVYANAKLTELNDGSSAPNSDIRMTYQTMDVMKTVADFYKNLGKTATGGWKITAQSASAKEGSLTLQNKPANGEENMAVSWSEDGGITTIRLHYWTYYNS